MFVFMLYVPVNNFSVLSGRFLAFLVWTSAKLIPIQSSAPDVSRTSDSSIIKSSTVSLSYRVPKMAVTSLSLILSGRQLHGQRFGCSHIDQTHVFIRRRYMRLAVLWYMTWLSLTWSGIWNLIYFQPNGDWQKQSGLFRLCVLTVLPAKSDIDFMLCLQLFSKTLTCLLH